MKKIVLALTALILIAFCMGLTSCAKTENLENFLCVLDEKTGTYTVTAYTGSETEIEVPSTLNGKTVGAIGKAAFRNNAKITKITLPESVKTVGDNAFMGCTALVSFEAKGIEAIPSGAFANCTALASVKLPEGLKSIGYRAFSGCKVLAAIDLPTTVETIYHYAFADCAALAEFNVKSDLSVYANAFSGCTALKTVSTPATPVDAVYKFSNGVMFSADGKTLVSFILSAETYEIPANVTSISAGAFYGNLSLTAITVASGNTAFSAVDGVLYSADGKTLVAYPAGKSGEGFTVPASVTAIADCAFCGNPLLKTVALSDTVTSVGKSAFEGCTGLVTLDAGNVSASVGESAFANCKALANYTVNDGAAAYKLIAGVLFTADETGLVSYPAGKTETSYTVPATVKTVAAKAFSLATALTEIKVAEGNADFKSEGGVLFSADGKTLVAYPAGKSGEYTVPASVTAVSAGAFAGCSKLTAVVLPAGVTVIESETFSGCAALARINMLGAVNKIGDNAFAGCTALTTVNYAGTEAQWASAKASGTGNDAIASIKPTYNFK